jgi:hypothetical protein
MEKLRSVDAGAGEGFYAAPDFRGLRRLMLARHRRGFWIHRFVPSLRPTRRLRFSWVVAGLGNVGVGAYVVVERSWFDRQGELCAQARVGPPIMVSTKSLPRTRAEGAMQLAQSLDRMSFPAHPETPGIPITTIAVDQCRYIIDDHVFPAVCCGARTPRASSWCDEHARIVFTPTGLTFMRQRGR